MTAHLPIPDRAHPTGFAHPARSRRHPATLLIALGACLAVLITAGCGDDDDEPNQSNQEALNSELAGLQDFALEVATSTPAQVVSQPQVEQLFGSFGLVLPVPRSGSQLVPLDFDAFTRPTPGGARKTALIGSGKVLAELGGIPYGTYERDVTSKTTPFPGWVFQTGTPADGFIFHFSEDDDFIIRDGLGERHISGEIRFLQTVFAIVGPDLVMTSTTWELGVDPLPVPVIHIPFAGVLVKGTTDYARVEFGDVDQPSNLTNCYFGTLAFDFLHDETDPADIATTLLAVDTTQNPDYVDLDQLNVTKGTPEEMTVRFGCGQSNDPSNPALDVTTHFTDIVVDPKTQELFANMTGTIEHRNRTIATLAGSLTEVRVDADVNGDGKITADDTCVDIDITFTDSGETQNICVAFLSQAQSLPFLPDGSSGSFRFGPIAF